MGLVGRAIRGAAGAVYRFISSRYPDLREQGVLDSGAYRELEKDCLALADSVYRLSRASEQSEGEASRERTRSSDLAKSVLTLEESNRQLGTVASQACERLGESNEIVRQYEQGEIGLARELKKSRGLCGMLKLSNRSYRLALRHSFDLAFNTSDYHKAVLVLDENGEVIYQNRNSLAVSGRVRWENLCQYGLNLASRDMQRVKVKKDFRGVVCPLTATATFLYKVILHKPVFTRFPAYKPVRVDSRIEIRKALGDAIRAAHVAKKALQDRGLDVSDIPMPEMPPEEDKGIVPSS